MNCGGDVDGNLGRRDRAEPPPSLQFSFICSHFLQNFSFDFPFPFPSIKSSVHAGAAAALPRRRTLEFSPATLIHHQMKRAYTIIITAANASSAAAAPRIRTTSHLQFFPLHISSSSKYAKHYTATPRLHYTYKYFFFSF